MIDKKSIFPLLQEFLLVNSEEINPQKKNISKGNRQENNTEEPWE